MTLNRRILTAGVATIGLVGLAGGGIAWAANDANSPSAAATSTAGHCSGTQGMYGKYSPMTAMANYLGLSRTEFVKQMHSGKTPAAIAKAQGKTVAGLRAAMVAAMKRNLAADTTLTTAQRTAMLALTNSHLDAMVTGTHMSGMDMDDMTGGSGSGMMGGSGSGMMGGSGSGKIGH